MRKILAGVIGSSFGIGFIPFASGTFASAAAALVCFFVPSFLQPAWFVPAVIVSVVLGVWAGGVMEEEYGEDPSQAVIDEVAGQWIALAFLPATPLVLFLSFVLFRVYDIVKPGLVDRAQRLPGGWGIMTDDVLAGIFANLTLRLIMLALPMLPYSWSF